MLLDNFDDVSNKQTKQIKANPNLYKLDFSDNSLCEEPPTKLGNNILNVSNLP